MNKNTKERNDQEKEVRKEFIDWYEFEREDSPYDPSFAASHFQTEDEYIRADLKYRSDREKEIAYGAWKKQQEIIAGLKEDVKNNKEKDHMLWILVVALIVAIVNVFIQVLAI